MIGLAKRVCEMRENADPLLKNKVANADNVLENLIKVVNKKTQLHENEALPIFLEHRENSIYEFAFSMAEEAEFRVLEEVMRNHEKELRNYLLLILSAVPESTPPKEYSKLIPAM